MTENLATDPQTPAPAAPVTPPAAPERPAWLPEKFKTPEDFAKSYNELEKKLGAPKPPQSPLSLPQNVQLADDVGLDGILKAAGVDEQGLYTRFIQNGNKLTDEDAAKLKSKLPLPRKAMEDYFGKLVADVQRQNQALEAEAKRIVGDDEAFNNLAAWGATSLSDADKQTYQTMISNPATMKAGVEWLAAKHRDAVGAGKAQPLINGAQHAAGGGQQFNTRSEITAAINDPKYKRDPAYRKSVDERIARSKPIYQLP